MIYRRTRLPAQRAEPRMPRRLRQEWEAHNDALWQSAWQKTAFRSVTDPAYDPCGAGPIPVRRRRRDR